MGALPLSAFRNPLSVGRGLPTTGERLLVGSRRLFSPTLALAAAQGYEILLNWLMEPDFETKFVHWRGRHTIITIHRRRWSHVVFTWAVFTKSRWRKYQGFPGRLLAPLILQKTNCNYLV